MVWCRVQRKGGAGRMDWIDQRTAKFVQFEREGSLDHEFGRTVSDNGNGLLATVLS